MPRYAEFNGHEIQKAYLESYQDYGQNLFDRYVDMPLPGSKMRTQDPDTGRLLNREFFEIPPVI